MREGSYAEIRKGMRVVGRDGETVGAVQEVLVDEGSGIFVGLTVRPNLFAHTLRVPGEAVDRVHEGVVHIQLIQSELSAYEAPDIRYREAEETFAESSG